MSLQDKISSAKPTTFLTDGLSKEEVKQAVDEGRMSDTVKLIIEIPKPMYENVQNGTYCGSIYPYLEKAIPLDNDSERLEVQAYFAGKTYGWEQATAEIRAEIVALAKTYPFVNHFDTYVKEDDVLQLLDNIGKESEE